MCVSREGELLSRPTSEGDPCDDRLDVPINGAVKADVAFIARAKGFGAGGSAAYVRSLIYRDLYGELKRCESVVENVVSLNGRKPAP